MLPVVLAIGAFVGVLFMGMAALSMGSGDRRWRRPAVADVREEAFQARGAPAFKPLQMEPFTLKWPSAVPHENKSILELPWPSETWDDEYFGTRSREDVRRIAQTADALDRKRARTTQQAQRKQAGTAEPAAEEARKEPSRPKKSKKAKKEEIREEATRRVGNVVEATKQAARAEVNDVAEAFFREAETEVPSPEEIAAYVRSYGLQSAIEYIRTRTGWDFAKSTQHLAQILRDRK